MDIPQNGLTQLCIWAFVVGVVQSAPVAGQAPELRKERLTAYADVVLDWHVATANISDETTAELRAVLRQSVTAIEASYDPRRPDFGLVMFAGRAAGPARAMFDGVPWRRHRPTPWRKAIDAKLKKKQHDVIRQKRASRHERQKLLAAEAATGVLDSVDGVSAEQHASLTNALLEERGDEMLNLPFTKEALPMFNLLTANKVKKHLSPAGRLQVHHIAERGRIRVSSRMTFRRQQDALQGEPDFKQFLTDIEGQLRPILRDHSHAVAQAYELDDKQDAKLQLAVRGVLIRKRKFWREEAESRMKEIRRLGGGPAFVFSTSVSVPVPILDNEPIWAKALDKILKTRSRAARQSTKLEHRSRVSHMMLIFDQELWLTENQQNELRELVETAIPQPAGSSATRPLGVNINDALRKADRSILSNILSDNQLAAWDTMKKLPPTVTDPTN